MEKKITLTVGEDEIDFVVTTLNYNKFQNDVTQDKKTAPAKNFLKNCLVKKHSEKKEDEAKIATYNDKQTELLNSFIDRGLAMELLGALLEEFRGDIEIAVKK